MQQFVMHAGESFASSAPSPPLRVLRIFCAPLMLMAAHLRHPTGRPKTGIEQETTTSDMSLRRSCRDKSLAIRDPLRRFFVSDRRPRPLYSVSSPSRVRLSQMDRHHPTISIHGRDCGEVRAMSYLTLCLKGTESPSAPQRYRGPACILDSTAQ